MYNVGQVEWLGFLFYGYLRILYLLQVLVITKEYKRFNWNIWCGKWSYMANNTGQQRFCPIKYDEFKWNLYGDPKVVALLLGMQLGCTKYCCFLCEWDSWDNKNHYVNKLWPKQTSLMPGEKNVVNSPLVFLEKIYLPRLHIKLGLMKNFVKGMDKTSRGFQYVRNKFPNVNDTIIKEGIFIGPQIRELMQDSLMKTWMRLKEMHGFHLRGFARTS